MRRIWIAAAACLAFAGPAFAGGRCSQPYAPVIKVSATTTKQDIMSLRDDVQSFIAASDIYQNCLVALNDDARIEANQAQKERIGQQFHNALQTFQKAHPG